MTYKPKKEDFVAARVVIRAVDTWRGKTPWESEDDGKLIKNLALYLCKLRIKSYQRGVIR